jgi:2-polyprenyl-6-methoxyphenol hydroxylase-like FAD-dependent oxidoreductase
VDVDAVVAGGGVAGSATAAALAALGWSVLIVEPGQHDERRLSGELIHPAGVAGLARLGLLAAPAFAAAVRLFGFAVFPGAGPSGCIRLPYQASETVPATALALDHAGICSSLLSEVAARPAVSLARGWRVTGLTGTPSEPVVWMRLAGASETLRCRLVVAADGASSPVRGHAGIGHRRTRSATLTGYLVDSDALPLPGHGHIFMAAGGPTLAYAIGRARARVLFNRPLAHGDAAHAHAQPGAATAALTPLLRTAVEQAMAAGGGRRFVSSDVTVASVARGRVVLVGDAAGSCHPISASGMSMGIDDAVRLAGALRRRDGDIPAALALYAAERRSRQRARVLLAAMLHDVLGGAAPEMGMLRAGLHRYWSGSARARAASMALLAMDDVGTGSILREVARVAAAGWSASWREPRATLWRAGLLARLSLPMMRNVVGALRVQ